MFHLFHILMYIIIINKKYFENNIEMFKTEFVSSPVKLKLKNLNSNLP